MSKIKQVRISKNLTQEKLARMMDITLAYYSQVEREVAQPSRSFMQKFKKIFPEISIDEMFFNQ